MTWQQYMLAVTQTLADKFTESYDWCNGSMFEDQHHAYLINLQCIYWNWLRDFLGQWHWQKKPHINHSFRRWKDWSCRFCSWSYGLHVADRSCFSRFFDWQLIHHRPVTHDLIIFDHFEIYFWVIWQQTRHTNERNYHPVVINFNSRRSLGCEFGYCNWRQCYTGREREVQGFSNLTNTSKVVHGLLASVIRWVTPGPHGSCAVIYRITVNRFIIPNQSVTWLISNIFIIYRLESWGVCLVVWNLSELSICTL